MVHTHLQLKWPNHSTHLLTRLTYLFKNEQLVDCTLMCNKHSLKVHRSVLAACSPYFERELQHNPSIVVKDMQFSVLKALIEFMYYGETRITEENLTSLIEAAKIFEVKGLSDMEVVDGKNGIASSTVATLDNDYIVESSCLSDDIDKASFEATTILQQSLANSKAATSSSMLDTNTTTFAIANNVAIPHRMNHCDDTLPLYEAPSGPNLMADTTDGTSYDDHQTNSVPHSSRNFVVTPPQTESAQILLSLARSHNQKLFTSHIDEDGNLANDDSVDSGFLNHDHAGDSRQINEDGSIVDFDQHQQQQQRHEHEKQQQQQQHSINNSNMIFTEHNLIINDTSQGTGLISMATAATSAAAVADANDVETETGSGIEGKSLLAKLLTRNNHDMEQVANNYTKSTAYEVAQKAKTATAATLTAADLQSSIIYDCPFLIETTDGTYVDVSMENMLNSLNGASSQESDTVDEAGLYDASLASGTMINLADPAILERIKQDTAPELENDPEAVVLTKISEDGRVEKYVLSSSDIEALKQLNERLAAAKAASNTSSRPSSADLAAEIEIPGDSSPLITKILVDGTGGIQNAINRLPFKKTVVGCEGAAAASPDGPPDSVHEAIMDGTLAVDDAHHHENMFEELDNQFNTMNCAIDDEEHIRRDYVAYEEASKNETQLEHNYYANALKMKDEDEEGVVINDQYDLRMMMMIEDPPAQHQQPDLQEGVAAGVKSKKRYQNVHLLGSATTSAADICLNGNTLVALTPKPTSATLRVNGGLNQVSASAIASSADKPITVVPPNGSGAGKCDLIVNDALMSSVLNNPAVASSTTAPAKPTPTLATKRKMVAAENNVLPFKCVKSANTFRNNASAKKSSATTKRTYNRKKPSEASNQNQPKKITAPFNRAFSNENNLIEEIIVDEIS